MTATISSDPPAAALLEDAARGQLPAWARAGAERCAHMARVAALLERWAVELGLPAVERRRWQAAAWLHDALRDAAPAELRAALPPQERDRAPGLLHGPAAAARLAAAGVSDEGLLCAVRAHTTGHPAFDNLGRALYLADYLEPGRPFDPVNNAVRRARLPGALTLVLRGVIADRMAQTMAAGFPVQPETLGFWNVVVEAIGV